MLEAEAVALMCPLAVRVAQEETVVGLLVQKDQEHRLTQQQILVVVVEAAAVHQVAQVVLEL
jgi:hypothetical protein